MCAGVLRFRLLAGERPKARSYIRTVHRIYGRNYVGEACDVKRCALDGSDSRHLGSRPWPRLYLVVITGSQAIGALLWGLVAEQTGLDAARLIAAGVVMAGVLAGLLWPVPETGRLDLQPLYWPALRRSRLPSGALGAVPGQRPSEALPRDLQRPLVGGAPAPARWARDRGGQSSRKNCSRVVGPAPEGGPSAATVTCPIAA